MASTASHTPDSYQCNKIKSLGCGSAHLQLLTRAITIVVMLRIDTENCEYDDKLLGRVQSKQATL